MPLFSRSLTLVPRSFLLNRTETLATQATVLSKSPTDKAISLPPRPQGFSALENRESPRNEVGNKDHSPLSNCTWINHTLLQHLCFSDSSIPQIQHLIESRPETKARVQELYDPSLLGDRAGKVLKIWQCLVTYQSCFHASLEVCLKQDNLQKPKKIDIAALNFNLNDQYRH